MGVDSACVGLMKNKQAEALFVEALVTLEFADIIVSLIV